MNITDVTKGDTFHYDERRGDGMRGWSVIDVDVVNGSLVATCPATARTSIFAFYQFQWNNTDFGGWTFMYSGANLSNVPSPVSHHWLNDVQVGDQFTWGIGYVSKWRVIAIDQVANQFQAETGNQIHPFSESETRANAFTWTDRAIWWASQPTPTNHGSQNTAVLRWPSVSPSIAPAFGLGDLQAAINQIHSTVLKGCPVCSGEIEHKTFSSFSYDYCPACKEDVAVLRKKR